MTSGPFSPVLLRPPRLKPSGTRESKGVTDGGHVGILPGKSRVEGESGGTQEAKVAPAACLSATWSPSRDPPPLSRASGVGLLVLVRSNS